jgi:hypothetical protein
MTIFGLVILILALGFVCWCVFKFGTEIPAGFKNLIYIVLIAVAILYTLSAFGILGSLNAPIPRVGGH